MNPFEVFHGNAVGETREPSTWHKTLPMAKYVAKVQANCRDGEHTAVAKDGVILWLCCDGLHAVLQARGIIRLPEPDLLADPRSV